MPRYNPGQIEPKWQKFWQQNRTFAAEAVPSGRKLYVLDMFPYPSGDGLHVGHPEGQTATDIVCRYQRMRSTSVLHPMGFDAFGLPAEEHAIQTGTPPRVQTERNIDNFRRQLKMLGFSFDWDRELATTDVDYFRWTQWIFLELFDTWFDPREQKGRPISQLPIPDEVTAEGEEAVRRYQDEHRLAYLSDALVNWCPALGTVLANEEVQDGKSERGGHPVTRLPLRQWMLRITAYADRLEKDLDQLDWSEGIKKLQRDWIGRSTGAEVDFYIGDKQQLDQWTAERGASGFSRKPADDVLRIYTDATRHALRRDLHGHRAGASVRRAAHDSRAGRSGQGLLSASGGQERPGAHGADQAKDRRLHGQLRRQSGRRRDGADLGGRLRADQLRHGGDYGRAGARYKGF